MSVLKIYRIRDRRTGLWSSGGGAPKFGKRGKTWDSLAHVSSHISCVGRVREDVADQYGHAEVVEYVITEQESRTIDVMGLVDRKLRQEALYDAFGRSVSDLVSSLEKQGQENTFRWIITVTHMGSDPEEWLKGFKGLGIRRSDYRTTGNAYAFSSKDAAIKAKLSCDGKVRSLDIVDLIEEF